MKIVNKAVAELNQKGKGIDDYLVHERPTDPAQTLQLLIADAAPFDDTLKKNVVDIGFVSTELARVEMPPAMRAHLARKLGKPLGVPAKELERLSKKDSDEDQPKSNIYASVYEPWAKEVDAKELFNLVTNQINKEVLIDEHQLFVCVLWIFFTWVHEHVDFSPILFITGPTRECGKTCLLKAISKFVRRPCKTANISPAALYRVVERHHPTILADEVQDQSENVDFWLVIKAGHVPGEPAIRCHPNTLEPEQFDVFCSKLLAGIGRAPAQVMSRSIVIEMERRLGKLQPQRDPDTPLFIEIRSKLQRWALDVDEDELKAVELPANTDVWLRNRNNWETLYQVACSIDPLVAQELLKHIPLFQEDEQDFTTYLLSALRTIYREEEQATEKGFISTEKLINELNKNEDAPWFSRSKDGISPHTLGRRLGYYKVKPVQIRESETSKKVRGYRYVDPRPRHSDLKRVFEHYLPKKEEEIEE